MRGICEKKLSLIHGSALERYKSVLENRPEIIESVTNKVLRYHAPAPLPPQETDRQRLINAIGTIRSYFSSSQ